MARALLQTINTTNLALAEGAVIPIGTTVRRIGELIQQNGNGIAITGTGYYTITVNVVLTPTEAGNVTVNLVNNGTIIPGAFATSSVTTVGNTVTLPITFTVKRGCCCDNIDNITCVLTAGASTLNNIVTNTIKE